MTNLVRRFRERGEREKARYGEECRRSREAARKWKTEIRPLPIEEAKRRADALLADSEHFRCETALITELERSKMGLLAPHVRAFFERYSGVRHVNEAGEYLGRALLWFQPVIMVDGKVNDQFFTVGWMGEENQLVVKQREETIRDMGPYGDNEDHDYPSIYHLILQLDLYSSELGSVSSAA